MQHVVCMLYFNLFLPLATSSTGDHAVRTIPSFIQSFPADPVPPQSDNGVCTRGAAADNRMRGKNRNSEVVSSEVKSRM